MSDHKPNSVGHGPGAGDHKPNSVPSPWAGVILIAFFGLCAALLLWDFFAHRHVEHPLEGWKAFYPAFGFVGIALLILVSKGLRRLVMRREDYYDDR